MNLYNAILAKEEGEKVRVNFNFFNLSLRVWFILKNIVIMCLKNSLTKGLKVYLTFTSNNKIIYFINYRSPHVIKIFYR